MCTQHHHSVSQFDVIHRKILMLASESCIVAALSEPYAGFLSEPGCELAPGERNPPYPVPEHLQCLQLEDHL